MAQGRAGRRGGDRLYPPDNIQEHNKSMVTFDGNRKPVWVHGFQEPAWRTPCCWCSAHEEGAGGLHSHSCKPRSAASTRTSVLLPLPGGPASRVQDKPRATKQPSTPLPHLSGQLLDQAYPKCCEWRIPYSVMCMAASLFLSYLADETLVHNEFGWE